jgi:hypothetical protein
MKKKNKYEERDQRVISSARSSKNHHAFFDSNLKLFLFFLQLGVGVYCTVCCKHEKDLVYNSIGKYSTKAAHPRDLTELYKHFYNLDHHSFVNHEYILLKLPPPFP